MTTANTSKSCAACGRTMRWRKRWANAWAQVRYCSERCRRRRVAALDMALEAAILELLSARSGGSTICPSEAARRVAPGDWRPLMERVRQAARRLSARGELEVLQRGRIVDPDTARGPIRLRRSRGI